jgi:hypothetical protein
MILLTFKSTHNALEIEEALLNEDISLMVIPTPRVISNGCGITLKFDKKNLEKVISIVDRHGIMDKSYYKEEVEGENREYKLID